MSCALEESIFNEASLKNITLFLLLSTFVTVFSIATNLICFITLIKRRTLQTPSNILVTGLCFSDLLLGLLVQPISLTYLFFIRTQKVHIASLQMVVVATAHTFIGLSFTYTTIINIDRFFAVCHPFKYFEKATRYTHLRVVVAVFFTWLIYVFLNNLILQQLVFQVLTMAYIVVALVCMLATNVEMIKVINKQNVAMRSVRVIANHRASRCHIQRQHKERSKAYTCIIITVAFFVCNIPLLVMFIYSTRTGVYCWSPYGVFIGNLWANFLTTVNSSINPVIYCIRMKAIRKAAKALLCGRHSDDVSSINQSN